MAKKIRCTRCGCPEADRGIARDGRPEYCCKRCGHVWTQGYPNSHRRRQWYAETRANKDFLND